MTRKPAPTATVAVVTPAAPPPTATKSQSSHCLAFRSCAFILPSLIAIYYIKMSIWVMGN
ncbi:hypothetical protein PM02_12680 [Sulfitobacter mediterraneus]|uniref:Uncharacterized protein n=1 Tax=Sulfitobacter mediterraneus TaxID=83219 RepID=A0A061SSW7_9RHOB|nr:hypothetical protein PM02_12680 [Sulfitobacter mediterraneus]